MIARALVAATGLIAGMVAVLDVGGTVADVAGLAAIVTALLIFDRAVFRAAGGRPDPAEREPGGPRLR